MERQEYTAETYPSFGKKYNGEKAIISLTSWRARINTVSKTIYSLIKQCPGFHIVLVLSEEEFPKMMEELPENLKLFAENELIEVLWVYKNVKAMKKVLFTMDKYRDVPVISADDDCTYNCNYAQEMYDVWLKDKNSVVRYTDFNYYDGYKGTQGPSTLYSPAVYYLFLDKLKDEKTFIEFQAYDDAFLSNTLLSNSVKIQSVAPRFCFTFHDEICAIHPNLKTLKLYAECYK